MLFPESLDSGGGQSGSIEWTGRDRDSGGTTAERAAALAPVDVPATAGSQPRNSLGCHGSLLRNPPSLKPFQMHFLSFNQMFSKTSSSSLMNSFDNVKVSPTFSLMAHAPALLWAPPHSGLHNLTHPWFPCQLCGEDTVNDSPTSIYTSATAWMFVSPNSSVMVLGGGAFRRWLGHVGGALTTGWVSL